MRSGAKNPTSEDAADASAFTALSGEGVAARVTVPAGGGVIPAPQWELDHQLCVCARVYAHAANPPVSRED